MSIEETKKIIENEHKQAFSKNGSKVITTDDFEYLRITEKTIIPYVPALVAINGKELVSAENITTISGGSKAGKSSIINYILACCISVNVEDMIPRFEVTFNSDKKAIVHVDTEQSKKDHQNKYMSMLKRANVHSTPEYLYSYNILVEEETKYKQLTHDFCYACHAKHNGIHLIIIDGGADYLLSTKPEEAAATLQFFRRLSIKFQCPVIQIVHTNPHNPNSQFQSEPKESGHYGSYSQRKSLALINLKSENDITTMIVKLSRHGGVKDFGKIRLMWDKDKEWQRPVTDTELAVMGLDDDEKKEASKQEFNKLKNEQKEAIDKSEATKLARKIFSPQKSLKRGELERAIADAYGTESTSNAHKRVVPKWLAWDIIDYNSSELRYRFKNKSTESPSDQID